MDSLCNRKKPIAGGEIDITNMFRHPEDHFVQQVSGVFKEFMEETGVGCVFAWPGEEGAKVGDIHVIVPIGADERHGGCVTYRFSLDELIDLEIDMNQVDGKCGEALTPLLQTLEAAVAKLRAAI